MQSVWLNRLQRCASAPIRKNKILNTLARECQVRGTDATGIAYNFNDRLRIYKRPIPARKMKIHIPNGVNSSWGIPV